MAAGAFTQEQIRHFRQVYSQYSQEGALSYESYRDAVGAALQRANLSSFPPAEVMDGEFARLSAGSGSLGWQQFFQVGGTAWGLECVGKRDGVGHISCPN